MGTKRIELDNGLTAIVDDETGEIVELGVPPEKIINGFNRSLQETMYYLDLMKVLMEGIREKGEAYEAELSR